MAADKFRGRVDHDIRSVLDGPQQIRCGKSRVDHQRNLMVMGNLCDGLHIRHFRIRIAKSLYVQRLCIVLNGLLKGLRTQRVHKGCGDAVIRQRVGQQVVASAVKILRRHDVSAAQGDILHRVGHCRRTGRCGNRCHAPLEGRHSLLKNLHRRVRKPGINIPRVFQSKPVCRMLRVMKNVGRGLINRHRSGVCGRVRLLLSHVQL